MIHMMIGITMVLTAQRVTEIIRTVGIRIRMILLIGCIVVVVGVICIIGGSMRMIMRGSIGERRTG